MSTPDCLELAVITACVLVRRRFFELRATFSYSSPLSAAVVYSTGITVAPPEDWDADIGDAGTGTARSSNMAPSNGFENWLAVRSLAACLAARDGRSADSGAEIARMSRRSQNWERDGVIGNDSVVSPRLFTSRTFISTRYAPKLIKWFK